MTIELTERTWDILACPLCSSYLEKADSGAVCSGCRKVFPRNDTGQIDCRLQETKSHQITFEVGPDLHIPDGFHFKPLAMNPTPQVDLSRLQIPTRLTRELVSYFPKPRTETSMMLDLGCGKAIHRGVCECAGFEYVGLDIASSDAEILGDAHALPFKNESFEFVLSVAVLEHVRYPFMMVEEVHRVLEPGGRFIGTVAFLEPFHSNSFYHFSHLGIYSALQSVGFQVERVAQSAQWSVLAAQAAMVLFPRLPTLISKLLVLPLHSLHRIWWRLANILARKPGASENHRTLYTTGAFAFVARKRTPVS